MLSRSFVGVCALLVLSACGDGGTTPAHPVLLGIDVMPAATTMFPGDTVRFSATPHYDRTPPTVAPVVHWISDQPTQLSIDSSGLATVIATSGAGINVTVKATIETVSGAAFVTIIKLKLSLNPSPAVLFAGMSRPTTALNDTSTSLYTDYVTIKPTSWSSDNPSVVTVDSAGVVTAVAPGHATISAIYPVSGRPQTIKSPTDVLAWPGFQFSSVSGNAFPEERISFASRQDRNCGLNATDGGIYCWGLVEPGMTPYDGCEFLYTEGMKVEANCSTVPLRVSAQASFTALSAGGEGGCGLTAAGDAYCFGLNTAGELGVAPAETMTAYRWTDHAATRVGTSEAFRSIYASGSQRCGIRADGLAFCWGSGVGPTPTQISTVAWTAMAQRSADAFNCGLATDSTAYCWSSSPIAPQRIDPTFRWTAIDVNSSTNDRSACGLAASGGVWCWTFTSGIQAPTAVTGGPPLVSIGPMLISKAPRSGPADYMTATCGLSTTGDVYCVTLSGTPPNYAYSLQPIDLGVKLKQFSGDCGIGVDGKAYCWSWRTLQAKVVPGQ